MLSLGLGPDFEHRSRVNDAARPPVLYVIICTIRIKDKLNIKVDYNKGICTVP